MGKKFFAISFKNKCLFAKQTYLRVIFSGLHPNVPGRTDSNPGISISTAQVLGLRIAQREGGK